MSIINTLVGIVTHLVSTVGGLGGLGSIFGL